MEITESSQRTLNDVPLWVRGVCPDCGSEHKFELDREGLVPEALADDAMNYASPLYETRECPEHPIVQTTSLEYDGPW
jgi:hypothetical protein